MWLSLTVPGPWDKQKNDLKVAPTISASCGVFFDSKGRAKHANSVAPTMSCCGESPYPSRAWASMAATAAMATMSSTSSPACRTCTGAPMPSRMGPMASASVRRESSL